MSATGRRQAGEASRRLASVGLDLVVSSPLERAVETATAVAAASGVPLHIDEALVEWRLTDRWADIAWEDLPSRRPGELEAYLGHPVDLDFTTETLADLAERMARATERWAHRGTVALVSHQDTVQAARLRLTGRALADLHRDKPGHAAVLHLEQSSDGWREIDHWAPGEDAAAPPRPS